MDEVKSKTDLRSLCLAAALILSTACSSPQPPTCKAFFVAEMNSIPFDTLKADKIQAWIMKQFSVRKDDISEEIGVGRGGVVIETKHKWRYGLHEFTSLNLDDGTLANISSEWKGPSKMTIDGVIKCLGKPSSYVAFVYPVVDSGDRLSFSMIYPQKGFVFNTLLSSNAKIISSTIVDWIITKPGTDGDVIQHLSPYDATDIYRSRVQKWPDQLEDLRAN